MSATVLFANNASTTLAGAITSTATTANLSSGTGSLFPSPSSGQYFVLTFTDAGTGLINEIVWVTDVSGDVITMTRAQEGTTAKAWNAGDFAANLWTAGQAALIAPQSLPAPYYQKTSGSYSQTIPAGVSSAKVTIGGGGGGGGGGTNIQASGGGGAGGVVILFLTGLVSAQSLSGTVGSGGNGGTTGNPGTAGSNTTLLNNAVLQATANGGGQGTVAFSSGGAGGTINIGAFSGTSILLIGSAGFDAATSATTYGGNGACGWLGAGAGKSSNGSAGEAAQAPCAGGGGTYDTTPESGGAGAAGFVLIEWSLN